MKTQNWLSLGILIIVIAIIAYFIGQSSNSPAQLTNTSTGSGVSVPITPTSAISNVQVVATTSASDAGIILHTPADWANTPIANNVGNHWKKISLGASSVTEDGITYSETIENLGQTILASDPVWGLRTGGINTTGKFVQVNLTMNNNTQSSAMVEIVLYYLADQAGRGYQFKETHSSCSGEADSIAVPQFLEPGIPCIAEILYEVSQQSQSFNLDFDARNDQYNGNVPYGG